MRNGFNPKWDSNSRRRPIISSYLDGPKTEGFDVSNPGPLTTFNEGWNFKNPNPCISPHMKGPFGFEAGIQYQGDFQMQPSYDFNHLRSEDDNFYRKNSGNFMRFNRNPNENLKSSNNLFFQIKNSEENQKQEDLFYKDERNERRGIMRKMEKNGNDGRQMDDRDDEESKKERADSKKKNYIEAFSFDDGQPNTRQRPTKLKDTFGEERHFFGIRRKDYLSQNLTGNFIQNGSEEGRPKWSKLEKEHFQGEYSEGAKSLEEVYKRMEVSVQNKRRLIDQLNQDVHNLLMDMEKIKIKIMEKKLNGMKRNRQRERKQFFGRKVKPLVLNFDINFNLNSTDFVAKHKMWTMEFLKKRANICTGDCNKGKNKQKQNDLKKKLGRVPYVMGENDDYVLVKFNREKKRDRVRHHKDVKEKFKNLWVVLKKVLWNEPIEQEDLDALNERDRKIIKAVLTKKKLVKKEESIKYTVDEFNKIPKRQGQKRNEENLKCIFKYAQKFLRLQFRKNHLDFRYRKGDVNMKQKNLIDLGFYTFYFGKIADQKGWPIAKFFHPKVFSGGKASLGSSLESPDKRPKTINREYIDNLKRSDVFMTHISDFLNNKYKLENKEKTGIIDQYKEISEEKMMQKMDQWCKLIKKNGDKKGLDKILDDLISNDKCKLPWSIREIQRAVEDTCNHFQIKLDKK
jgi:hypothetical protein